MNLGDVRKSPYYCIRSEIFVTEKFTKSVPTSIIHTHCPVFMTRKKKTDLGKGKGREFVEWFELYLSIAVRNFISESSGNGINVIYVHRC